jgi:hypothetical protein
MNTLTTVKNPVNPEVKAKLYTYLHNCKELDSIIKYYDLLPDSTREGLECDVRLVSHDTEDKAVQLWKLVEKVFFDNVHLFNSDGPMIAFQRDFPEIYEKQKKDLAAQEARMKTINLALKAFGLAGSLIFAFHLSSPIHGQYDGTVLLNNSSVLIDQTKPLLGDFRDFKLIGYYQDGFYVATSASTQFKYIVVRVTLSDGLDPLEVKIMADEFEDYFGRRGFRK